MRKWEYSTSHLYWQASGDKVYLFAAQHSMGPIRQYVLKLLPEEVHVHNVSAECYGLNGDPIHYPSVIVATYWLQREPYCRVGLEVR